MNETTWMRRGACRHEDPELFQPAGETDAYAAQIAEAKAVCSVCPVVLNCYAHILANPDEVGIWAGTTEMERAELRGELTKKRCTGCTRVLPASEFYRRPALKGGLRNRCKRCENRGTAAGKRRQTPTKELASA